MGEELVEEGSRVLLYLNERRQYLVRVEASRDLHTHRGYIKHSELIGKPYGAKVKSSMNVEFVLLPPLLRDYVARFSRRTQVLYAKDIGLILTYCGVRAGSKVIEAGTGSGALTCILASIVGPSGRVFSYEVKEEFLKVAEENLRSVGLADLVVLQLKDAVQGFEETSVDAVILDLASPWLIIPKAREALKRGGVLLSFSPTIDQIQKTLTVMRSEGFIWIEVLESILRTWQTAEGKLRPETLMIGHTGFLSVARKIG